MARVHGGSAMTDKRKNLRCAIYTRKSSEEGLEQDFNSLHAQREACIAFVASQKHEGWVPLPANYDDGGISGGTMERPALKRLLADVAAGSIDVVVVYKIDRLTRSLLDFAKIVEIFDKRNVSFVSVTQQFSTTSSMGRLTLNVLLSFAQFEREVTGERIRDKIAASKKKGMWMGGFVPLGYRANDRTLAIDEAEAATVRTIFALYLELKNVRLVADELRARGLLTKQYLSKSDKATGGKPFSRGHIYRILSNAIYVGEIEHKGQRHPGLHPAIVDRAAFDAAQALLAANGREHRVRAKARDVSPPAGLLFDGAGNRDGSTHAGKNGKRYRYYTALAKRDGHDTPSLRISAAEIEAFVVRHLVEFFRDEKGLVATLGPKLARTGLVGPAMKNGRQLATNLETNSAIDRQTMLS